jgi:AsmA protein
MSQKGRKSRPKAARFQEFPMYDRRLVAGGAAIALLAVAALAFVLMAPRVAASGLAALAQQQLGRSVTAGGTHLAFSPLAVRLDDAVLSGATPDDDSFATARSAVIPVTLGQLLGAAPQLSELALTEPDIALLINERGEANWSFPGLAPGAALRLRLEQGRFRYFDARNGQAMALSRVDGVLDLGADGGATFAGTAVINSRLVRIDADLKSLARVNADGSPLELALAADDGSASFSGRVSTASVLSLAGPVSLSSPSPAAGLRLLGIPVPEATVIAGPLAIDGALDSAGRAFAIRNATLGAGAFQAVGEFGADLRNERPRLQARIAADRLSLDAFVPRSGAGNGDWGRLPLPFAVLKTIDAEAAVEVRSLGYAGFTAGASRLGVTLTDGKLEVSGAAQLADDGTLNFTTRADANAVPPSVALNITANETAVQPLLAALTGVSQLTGTGGFTADLTATGTTQEELAGTLKGTASLDVVNGRIAGVDLTGLILAARQKILDGWSAAPGGTDFTRLAGAATVSDGIASFRGVQIDGAAAAFTLEGLIDVLRQGIAISATGTANGQPLLPVPVVAQGLWAKPKIYPDIPNILSNPEGGFAKLQDVTPLQGN